jgi:hypothetical protein
MARFPLTICKVLFLLGGLAVAQAQTARPVLPGPRPSPTRTTTPQVSPPLPTADTPANMAAHPVQPTARPADGPTSPPVPPVVTYRDGLLTVQALNSNLGSVLTAIRNKTGIEFEGAENVSERVAISLGPAPEGEVLSAILAGSKYGFVAIGRPDSPGIVQRVIISVKNKTGAVAEAQAQPRPAGRQEGDEEENPDEQPSLGGDPQDTPVQPIPVPQQAAPQAETPPQSQPKSPEQLLQELQEMRRQKNSPPGDPNAPPAPQKQPPL